VGHGTELDWDNDLWDFTSTPNNLTRALVKTRAIPEGTLHFGTYIVAKSSKPGGAAIAKPLRFSGKWSVDRSQITPTNLKVWPRKPLISLREVTITEKTAGGGVTGECVFQLDGVGMDTGTSFEISFSSGCSWGMGLHPRTAETPRTRVRQWSVSQPTTGGSYFVSGRVSADNRWPLGFEIEPFNFKSARVGQKLKFNQGPVSLPKS
jgi:hypothetical protein